MIFQKLGLINKNQRGFTVIELIVAVAIAGVIAGGTAITIYQTVSGNARNGSHMTAVRQVQTAGYWISRDAQMAQTINSNPEDDLLTQGTEVLTLSWEGWEYSLGGSETYIDTHEVRYAHDAASSKLWRYQKITTNEYDDEGNVIDTYYSPSVGWNTSLIAEHITPIGEGDLNMDEANNKLTVTITASVTSWVGESVEERTYEITPRPSPSD